MIVILSSVVAFFIWYMIPVSQDKETEKELHQIPPESDQIDEGKRRLRTRSRDRVFPDTIEGFGYKFNEDGELRQIESNNRFEFNVYPDQDSNQKHYEALGEVLTEHIYELLEKDCGLCKLSVPANVTKNEAAGFIFASADALTNEDKLLVLIHGSGVVRAGQWARRLIINENLQSGTQIPFIKKALEEGYGVLVMNTNQNSATNILGKSKQIRGSETPTKHAKYVWKKYINSAKAKNIAIIAHSFGGVCVLSLAAHFPKEFEERVFAVALTDSVHTISSSPLLKETRKHLFAVGKNWVSSHKDLDEAVIKRGSHEDIECVSAGVMQHEMTSWASFKSIFDFLSDRYHEMARGKEHNSRPERIRRNSGSRHRGSLQDIPWKDTVKEGHHDDHNIDDKKQSNTKLSDSDGENSEVIKSEESTEKGSLKTEEVDTGSSINEAGEELSEAEQNRTPSVDSNLQQNVSNEEKGSKSHNENPQEKNSVKKGEAFTENTADKTDKTDENMDETNQTFKESHL